ncbi:hypothetical protein B0H14DRAFT_2589015 [Mycena olivaceomarginata]|nr:hypothetical protein B0H14DRAFT_2589015 [Mycena olivaceomarginata]
MGFQILISKWNALALPGTPVSTRTSWFHKAKGFDPHSQEVAIHLSCPLLQVSCDRNTLFTNVEDSCTSVSDAGQNRSGNDQYGAISGVSSSNFLAAHFSAVESTGCVQDFTRNGILNEADKGDVSEHEEIHPNVNHSHPEDEANVELPTAIFNLELDMFVPSQGWEIVIKGKVQSSPRFFFGDYAECLDCKRMGFENSRASLVINQEVWHLLFVLQHGSYSQHVVNPGHVRRGGQHSSSDANIKEILVSGVHVGNCKRSSCSLLIVEYEPGNLFVVLVGSEAQDLGVGIATDFATINATINATGRRHTSAAITPSSHQFLCHLFSSASFAASAIFGCSVLPESMQDLQ